MTASDIWTDWVQNQLAAQYPEALQYRVEIVAGQARLIDASGKIRGRWAAQDKDFVGHLLTAVDPSLRRKDEFADQIVNQIKELFVKILRWT